MKRKQSQNSSIMSSHQSKTADGVDGLQSSIRFIPAVTGESAMVSMASMKV